MVSIKYTEDEGNTQFLQTLKPQSETMEDCCQIAKDVFNEKVRSAIMANATGRQKEILPDLINIDNLSCEDFKKMLDRLSSITSASGDLVTATTNAISRYIRLDKIPTSMFNMVANIVKQAGALAYEEWIRCQKRSMMNTADPSWQSTLERSEDNKFNTWDNILLAAYKPLEDEQKMSIAMEFIVRRVVDILKREGALPMRTLYDALLGETTRLPAAQKIRGVLIKASKGTLSKPSLVKFNNMFERTYDKDGMSVFSLVGEEE